MNTHDLIRVGSKLWNISEGHLRSQKKTRYLARRRQVICFFAIRKTNASSTVIGRAIGGRDHTTILHAARVIGRLRDKGDPEVVKLCDEFEAAAEDLLKRRSCPSCIEAWKAKLFDEPAPRVVTYIPPGGIPPARPSARSQRRERTCLTCGDTFMSSGPGNRRCNKTSCRDARRSMSHLEGVAA